MPPTHLISWSLRRGFWWWTCGDCWRGGGTADLGSILGSVFDRNKTEKHDFEQILRRFLRIDFEPACGAPPLKLPSPGSITRLPGVGGFQP